MRPDRTDGIEFSVVIASVESARSIERCIRSVQEAVKGTRAEVIVVDASRDESAEIAERTAGAERVIRCAPGTLTPDLWAVGIERSAGRVVALTTGHFTVEPTWSETLCLGLEPGTVGVAGMVDLAEDTRITDWAVFYLRYSEFLSEPDWFKRDVPGIPADNAAYDGEAIRRFVMDTGEGFWEVEFHRRLRATGGRLSVVPGAVAHYRRSFPFLTILAHRFRHGRHAGAWRVAVGERSALAVVVASPLVPTILAARTWRRVCAFAHHRVRFLRALPVFVTLAASWALGEAVGALAGIPAHRRAAPVPA